MIVLTTGKGGVGKTTVAALTGLRLAAEGTRTALVSIDPAHSLSDVLTPPELPPASLPAALDVHEVRLSAELDRHWGTIQQYLARLLQSQGVAAWRAEDVAYLPGLEELTALLKLAELETDYDTVVVDCPPTGSTLRYLNLPEAARWYMEKFFPWERKLVQAVGPVAERAVGVPMPDRGVFDAVEALFRQVAQLREILTDPDRTRAQVVTTAESVVLRETERALGYLQLQGVPVGRLWFNRQPQPLPSLTRARAQFAPLACEALAQQPEEPLGAAALSAWAERIFSACDPVPAAQKSVAVSVDDGDRHVLRLGLARPQAAGAFRVGRRGDDLLIDWGPLRRRLPLPPALAARQVAGARWTETGLVVEFSDE